MQFHFNLKRWFYPALFVAGMLSLNACSSPKPSVTANNINPYQPQPYVQLCHREWSKDAAVYQINIRQFTAQGTFSAAAEQLNRLKDLGVKILWLMPVQPIGELNRKGT